MRLNDIKYTTLLVLTFGLQVNLIAQQLSNCSTNNIELVEIDSQFSVYSSNGDVQINFDESCGCNSISDCTILNILLPEDSECFGMFIQLSQTFLPQDISLNATEDKDFFDLYYLPDCEYFGLDNLSWTRQKNNYSFTFSEQIGGSVQTLICKGDHFTQNSLPITISTSDYCQEIPNATCCPISQAETIQESNNGYASFDFGSLQFPSTCGGQYVELVKDLKGNALGDGTVLPFPCGSHDLILQINNNGVVNACPFVLEVVCSPSSDCCFDYDEGNFIEGQGEVKLSNRSMIKKYSDICVDGNLPYIGTSIFDSGFDAHLIVGDGCSTPSITLRGDKNESVSEVFVDSDDIYLIGSFNSQTLTGTGGVTLSNSSENEHTYDTYVSKWDKNAFTPKWSFSFGGNFQDVPEDFYQISNTEFVIVGTSYNSVDFGGVSSCLDNAVKGYVAFYEELGSNPPVCKWVRSVEFQTDGSLTYGLGLTASNDRIYISGRYDNKNNLSDLLQFRDEQCNQLGTFSVAAKTHGGYIAELALDGSLMNLINIGSDQWNLDLEIKGDHLYGVGHNSLTKHTIPGLTNPIVKAEANHIFREMVIVGDELKLVGWTGTKSILASYDQTLNKICDINPGENAYSIGTSISSNGQGIWTLMMSSKNDFKPLFPCSDSPSLPLENCNGSLNATPLSLFIGKYN